MLKGWAEKTSEKGLIRDFWNRYHAGHECNDEAPFECLDATCEEMGLPDCDSVHYCSSTCTPTYFSCGVKYPNAAVKKCEFKWDDLKNLDFWKRDD